MSKRGKERKEKGQGKGQGSIPSLFFHFQPYLTINVIFNPN